MAGLPWFKHYPRDFLIEVFGMSDYEELLLRRLLDRSWDYDGRLPNDDKVLAKLAQCDDSSWQKARSSVVAHFKISNGFLCRESHREQLKTADSLHAARVRGGQKTAATRWGNKRKVDHSPATSPATSPANGSANGSANSPAVAEQIAQQPQRSETESNNKRELPTEESKTPLPRPRARQRHVPNKIKGLGVTGGRSAPLARPKASPKTNGIGLKSHRKELLRQKLYRFSDATKTGEERHKAFEGLTGADPEHSEQWWLDHLDRQMRIANWNDVPK